MKHMSENLTLMEGVMNKKIIAKVIITRPTPYNYPLNP